MTERLYYKNPYEFAFQANVLDTIEEDGRLGVVLDRTCFYPEGGGQPSDRGWLGEAEVTDVQIRNNRIVHFISKPLTKGPIEGNVDRERRLDFMQQHTGQHILSQCLERIGNYKTASVHFGDSYTTVETDSENVAEKDLQLAEEMANEVINRNVPVKIVWVNPEQVSQYNIRKPPPDVEKVRIVEIENFDFSACGGTHVSRTGEVGLLKIIGTEKIRGHLRLRAKIGRRALQDYGQKTVLVQQLLQALTCGEDEIIQRVMDLQSQIKEKQRELAKVQSDFMANQVKISLMNASDHRGVKLVHQVFDETDSNMLKTFVAEATSIPGTVAAAIGAKDTQVRWVIGHSAGERINLLPIVKPLLSLIEGKGGGKENLMQGGGSYAGGVTEFIDQVEMKIKTELNNE